MCNDDDRISPDDSGNRSVDLKFIALDILRMLPHDLDEGRFVLDFTGELLERIYGEDAEMPLENVAGERSEIETASH